MAHFIHHSIEAPESVEFEAHSNVQLPVQKEQNEAVTAIEASGYVAYVVVVFLLWDMFTRNKFCGLASMNLYFILGNRNKANLHSRTMAFVAESRNSLYYLRRGNNFSSLQLDKHGYIVYYIHKDELVIFTSKCSAGQMTKLATKITPFSQGIYGPFLFPTSSFAKLFNARIYGASLQFTVTRLVLVIQQQNYLFFSPCFNKPASQINDWAYH
ncbi:hypothetical protein BDF20DRAFT_836811 [Mycotypha africana]|uniref:uncharacterized protein n=1 Tax=Mycotypha africana TaxID=64632 RepID=UPI0022FFD30E|nr:uncharacterized protein BDF20DRAFT_836811 [Mycotypha africana]KAI8975405.1 hypothetical protein BDF20DRAFT_836811 [Mycotypha africana]